MRGFIGAAILTAVLAGPAQAGMTFDIGGSFGPGETFSGTFTVDALPVSATVAVTRFDLSFSDPSIEREWLANRGNSSVEGWVGPDLRNPDRHGVGHDVGLDALVLSFGYSFAGQYILVLDFRSPFDGTGQVVPYGVAESFSSLQWYELADSSVSPIFSGHSAVPEPSSLALCGIAGVAGLGIARARKVA